MVSASPAAPTPPPSRWALTPTKQIILALVLGVAWGMLFPQWTKGLELPRDIFLHLIKMMIAPLVFASIVQGIAGTGNMKKVGRIGGKSLLYFTVVTALALVFGLLAVNLIQPGAGVTLPNAGNLTDKKPLTVMEMILHVFPTSVTSAMANNDVLQIVCFSVIFALGVIAAGDAGKPVLRFCDSLTQVMFKFAGIVMKFAPFGVGAAIAVTIGKQGTDVLFNLGKIIFTLYVALIVFVFCIFGLVIWIARVPLKPFFRAVREPVTIAFSTANSEAALPKAFAAMEKFGVPRGIVGFVLPAGYTFNLDGSALYLAVAAIFVAQAAETTSGVHFGIGQQAALMLTLMLTSKGVAAVPRASLVVLIAALDKFGLPQGGAAILLGIDAVMDMARTSVNVLGNCLATVVVARWEGEFDESKAHANFSGAPDTPAPDSVTETTTAEIARSAESHRNH